MLAGPCSVFSAVRSYDRQSCRSSCVYRRNRTLRKLLTAAHTYSHNRSRITSISVEPNSAATSAGSRPCPTVAGFLSKVTVGRGEGDDFTIVTSAPALVSPSTARRRALSPEHACSGTIAHILRMAREKDQPKSREFSAPHARLNMRTDRRYNRPHANGYGNIGPAIS